MLVLEARHREVIQVEVLKVKVDKILLLPCVHAILIKPEAVKTMFY